MDIIYDGVKENNENMADSPMKEITDKTSGSICPLPFIHTYVTARGSLSPCCEAQETAMGSEDQTIQERWNGADYLKLREQLINGEKPEVCRKCWANEKGGLRSNRQDMWTNFERGMWGQREIFVSSDYQVEVPPKFIEMKSSNLCNLKCRMCHPSSSHRIIEDREIIEKYRKGLPWKSKVSKSTKTVNEILEHKGVFFEKLKVLQFSGGEPLISDDHFRIVEALLEQDASDVELRYSTNLTILEHKGMKFLDVWKRFRKVNVKISMDGLDDVYNYIRVGADFDQVLGNIHKLKELASPNMTFNIGFTTQAYNVFQLPEFLDFFEKLIPREGITTHTLHTPEMMGPAVFPSFIKEKIVSKLRSRRNDLKDLSNHIESSEVAPELWDSLVNYSSELEEKYNSPLRFMNLLEKGLSS